MELIDKNAVVAEIKRIEYETNYEPFTDEVFGKRKVCKDIKDFLNTIEVKGVDLENDIQNVIHNHFFDLNGIAIVGTSSYATVDDMVYIAKHFFELGLKAQKGE